MKGRGFLRDLRFAAYIQNSPGKNLLPGQRGAPLQRQTAALGLPPNVLPEALFIPFVQHVKGQPGGHLHRAGKIQRLHRNALISPFPMHHIHKAQEGKAQFLSGSRLPDEAAFQRAPAHIHFPPEIPEPHLAQIQLFAVQRDFRRRDRPDF